MHRPHSDQLGFRYYQHNNTAPFRVLAVTMLQRLQRRTIMMSNLSCKCGCDVRTLVVQGSDTYIRERIFPFLLEPLIEPITFIHMWLCSWQERANNGINTTRFFSKSASILIQKTESTHTRLREMGQIRSSVMVISTASKSSELQARSSSGIIHIRSHGIHPPRSFFCSMITSTSPSRA